MMVMDAKKGCEQYGLGDKVDKQVDEVRLDGQKDSQSFVFYSMPVSRRCILTCAVDVARAWLNSGHHRIVVMLSDVVQFL